MESIIDSIHTLQTRGLKKWYADLKMVTKIKTYSILGFTLTYFMGMAFRIPFLTLCAMIFILIYFAAFMATNIKQATVWLSHRKDAVARIRNTLRELIRSQKGSRRKK